MTTFNNISQKHGVDLNQLDQTADPKTDFYRYATGGWCDAHPLQGEYASFGVFNLLSENARDNVRDLIDNLKNDPESKIEGTIAQKVADLYAMGLDVERLAKEGNTPLQPILTRIENFTSDKLAETIAWLSIGIDNTFFGYGVAPDFGDSKRNILHITEAGIGLGDRDYYLVKSDKNDQIMAAYRKYICNIMHLAGYSVEEAQRISDTVIKIETEYAKNKKTREESRDPLLRYNVMSLDELEEKFQNIPWRDIFAKSGIEDVTNVNISSMKFIKFINDYIPTLDEREIKDMMAYGSVSSSSGALSEDFYDLDFEMFGKIMSGTEEKRPRWKRAQGMVGSLFGEAIGQLYVNKYFPEKNKKYMLGLVENLRAALKKHIEELSWMSEETKAKAIEKLEGMRVKIGYPDKWKDYSEIKIDPNISYMENLLKASEWFAKDNYSKLNKPVDREEWHMYPQTVNAYYSPQMNEICFPAGILQPPFFDIEAEDALNYGGIGVVIGHEMTHAFDDSGRQYDKFGNLNNWWTEEDEKKFNSLADKLIEQFDEIEVAPGVKANGKFTLGENIADQGGLRVALTALKMASSDEDLDSLDKDGLNALQKFYISYGGVWANNIRPEEILVRNQTDPHSLARNRVNVTLKNIQPFIEAFNITKGDKMYRDEKDQVIIW
ncbi:MAG: M13 family metallopeptidase [Bacteroidales bacterium]|nr:M13 family metallopeptidase [Bacteroidales bacterium]MBD5302355.1 M13 family metallopeptidase [Bacteroides sp.]